MTFRFAFVLGLAFIASSATAMAQDPSPKLSGGFIQYQGATTALSKDDWLRVCQAMLNIGLKTVILQQTEFQDGETVTSYIPRKKGELDPTDIILKFADDKKMNVFVGLRYVKQWDTIRKNEGEATKQLDANKLLASKVWDRYKKHPSFAGWYLPQELANYGYSDDEIAILKGFFEALSKHCTTLANGKGVAISPYFNPCLAEPKQFSSDIKRIVQ